MPTLTSRAFSFSCSSTSSDVQRLGDRTKQQLRLSFDPPRPSVVALILGRDVALQPLTPADRARRAHPKSLRRLAARKTSFNSIHHTATKIDGQSFCHACQPPLASTHLESELS
jgi:hypothetical protein